MPRTRTAPGFCESSFSAFFLLLIATTFASRETRRFKLLLGGRNLFGTYFWTVSSSLSCSKLLSSELDSDKIGIGSVFKAAGEDGKVLVALVPRV
jgi:hypothetical protein